MHCCQLPTCLLSHVVIEISQDVFGTLRLTRWGYSSYMLNTTSHYLILRCAAAATTSGKSRHLVQIVQHFLTRLVLFAGREALHMKILVRALQDHTCSTQQVQTSPTKGEGVYHKLEVSVLPSKRAKQGACHRGQCSQLLLQANGTITCASVCLVNLELKFAHKLLERSHVVTCACIHGGAIRIDACKPLGITLMPLEQSWQCCRTWRPCILRQRWVMFGIVESWCGATGYSANQQCTTSRNMTY